MVQSNRTMDSFNLESESFPESEICLRASDSTYYTENEEMDIEADLDPFVHLDRKRSQSVDLCGNEQNLITLTSDTTRKLVDSMFGNFWRFEICQEAVFLCLGLMKLYFKSRALKKSQLQTVGLVCMYIASKYSDLAKLTLLDILPHCRDAQSADDLIQIEADVLELIGFDLELPTILKYYEAYMNHFNHSPEEYLKTVFWLQVSLLQDLMGQDNEKELLKDIISFIGNPLQKPNRIRELAQFISKTEHKYLVKRYQSCLNIQAYLAEVQAL